MDVMNKTDDDSTSDIGYEVPNNMEATQSDLPHIRDPADSTTEPADQNDMKLQLDQVLTNSGEQKDISPGHAEDPSLDVHSDASTEYSDKDDGPCCSPGNVEERSSLPTVCTSYINISKTEQNQTIYDERPSLPAVGTSNTQVEQNKAIYVDNPFVEKEEFPPKDIYNTKGCNANNVVQYQLKDTSRKEASAAAYLRDGDVDDASGDRPDVQVHDANSKAQDVNQDETRPKTVTKESKDAESCDQNKAEKTAVSDDECIRPYAVAYHRGGKTNGEPYAIAFDEQDGTRPEPIIKQSKDADSFDQTKAENSAVSDDECIRPYATAYCRDGEANGEQDVQPYAVAYDERDEHYENQTPTEHSQSVRGQPAAGTSSGADDDKADGLLSNPMYQGNALRPNPMYRGNALRHIPMYAQNAVQPRAGGEKGSNESKQSKIVFGEEGEEVGQFSDPSDVVVSPSKEIFVANYLNRRVQVFNMTGAYLRHFPTIVSGEDSGMIEPEDISIDGEGHLWVLGNDDLGTGLIVRYTKTGRHLATLYEALNSSSLLCMAVDTLRSLVVLVESTSLAESWDDYDEVKLLHFNGTVVRKFRTGQGPESPGRVAVGREGNLFFTDHMGGTRVYVYDNTGHYLFSFGGDKIGDISDGQAEEVSEVCTDSSGNILVSTGSGGTVELFTEDGRYVRRVVSDMFRADSIAVAPGGQLVVASYQSSTVTVFSHYSFSKY
ncbi:TRIM3 [Branchiostoma lanceolatum]|uniref:TRIM3 protein n=1 Tax=Branchiostoma lanceolatum TaxID=7740 RepID=A0A8J9ZVR3_BRALA|nr:TRIM3 [Branchiostoma lanceolatum]